MIWVLAACGTDAELLVEVEQAASNRDLVPMASERATFSWEVDGEPTSHTTRVPARALSAGQTWTVTATHRDGRTATVDHVVPEPPGGNVLVMLFDDVGVDKLAAYDGPYAPPTPRLDALAAEGVRFTRAYASPVCTPTRGVLMTGRHARRTGMGWIADTGARNSQLSTTETIIPEILPEGWSNSAVGKWHLAGPQAADWLTHPNRSGFDWYAGSPGNPAYAAGLGYHEWERNQNGEVVWSTTYMTTDSVDTALERIEAMPEPWFLYIAFNAVHGPLNNPPVSLVGEEGRAQSGDDPHLFYDAILGALDLEVGRLLDTMDPAVRERTTILTIGDNGTMPNGVPRDAPSNRLKHTPYEGGIRVPFIANGPLVAQPGSTSEALVHVADVLPTVAEIAGVPLEGPEGELLVVNDQETVLDGRSLVKHLLDPDAPGREMVYAEAFFPNSPTGPWSLDRRALQTRTHKLVLDDGLESFYRLEPPLYWDDVDLLGQGLDLTDEDQQALDSLRAAMMEKVAQMAPLSAE